VVTGLLPEPSIDMSAVHAVALALSCLTASCDEGRAKRERKVGAQSGVHWCIRVIAFGLLGV
jgi:hypothetical protein